MANRIHLSDWDAVTDELRRFGEAGDVTTGDDRIRIDFGSAYLEISRTGRVSTGMPLHDFEQRKAVDLVVNHDAGSLTIDADDVVYTFRRPGG
ncbi:hypothetical protein Htur_0777 [Haloterrigena turkmenica DSM 5511]|uniref:Uncharacterized protein n=1 Tax=Haloterrigena turkmenica (strain ATCC 51198 / DSM 5511 / JCM 9101 / NCIMB 13204 / VKM B-1734 / 4k) TaxID=543526 RepID=D2RX61_HALTV|nr:hypothetical protein [Haloterrigena turkmenica]ADB59673.1 hypothetical protein Htur_0777 [Haloterrigena turkmenica DSM 5511]